MGTVTLREVVVQRDGRTVLDVPDLTLTERRVGVLGANGSGKSTLLRLLDALVVPTRGTVTVDGFDTVHDGREVRRRVGFCFQDPGDQIVLPVVGDDVAFGLKNRGVPAAARATLVAETLARLGVADLATRTVATLSGGERQLVALAAVLVTNPATVLFDEPTGSLDLARGLAFTRLLATLDQQAVVATHDLDLVAGFDRVLVLDAGRVVVDAGPDEAVATYRALAARDAAGVRPGGTT